MKKPINIYDYYKDFYHNKAIQQIAKIPRWTISTPDKVPINIVKFIKSNFQIAEGCGDETTQCMKLFDMMNQVPNAINNTFYLDAYRDGFVVLDVEPKCSDKLKEKFLNLPHLYAERSMSGHGYHLLFKLPDLINDYPELKIKRVWKSPEKDYELLFNHTITFTRDTQNIPKSNQSESFDTFFKELAKKQEIINVSEVDIDSIKPNNIPLETYILDALAESPLLNKDLSDYHNDYSAFEMGQITKLVTNFYLLTYNDEVIQSCNHTFTDTEIAWLVYEELKNRIPYRQKHETLRNGVPYLLYSISRSIGGYKIQQEENRQVYLQNQKEKLQKKVDEYNKNWKKKQK